MWSCAACAYYTKALLVDLGRRRYPRRDCVAMYGDAHHCSSFTHHHPLLLTLFVLLMPFVGTSGPVEPSVTISSDRFE